MAARTRLLFGLLFLTFLAVGFAAPRDAKASIVLVNSANNGSTSAATNISATLSASSGNVLVVVCRQDNTSSDTQSVSDAAGNTFLPVISERIPKNDSDLIKMWYAKNIKGNAADVITCNFGGSLSAIGIIALQYSGLDVFNPLDAKTTGTVPNVPAGSPSTSVTTRLFSTAAANEVIIVCASGDAGGTRVAGSGYAIESTEAVNETACEDKTVSSLQSNVSASMSSDTSQGWEMVLGTFRAALTGTQVTSRSDTLSDSRPSATSNHTFAFTVNTAIYGSSVSNSSTLTLSPDSTFTVPSGLDCGDIDAATSSQFNFNWPSCQATATAWGFSAQETGISFVQQNATHGGAVSTNSTAFAIGNWAGDLIVAVATWDNINASITSITDSAGNTYASALGPVNWNGAAPTIRTQIFYAKNIQAGTNTVTANLSAAAGSFFQLFIFEYRGADTLAPLDATHSATSSSGTALDSGSAVTNYPNELIFGAGEAFGNVNSPGAGFTSRSTLDNTEMEDKSVTSIGSYKTTATGDGTAWEMLMVTFKAAAGSTFTLIPPTGTGELVATGTQITIKIGSNATVQQQGAHWLTNPTSAGIYTITVGGTFGGSGNILVAINSAVTVQATVAESLSLTITGVASGSCGADDGASVTQFSGVTAVSVPFGTINSNTFYQGCQDVSVSTNAGGGYSLTVQENSVMKTANGANTIPDTTCDGGLCSSASSGKWVTATKYGLGHTCLDQAGHDCSPQYSSGTRFRPFANVAAGTAFTPAYVNGCHKAGTASSDSCTIPGATANDVVAAYIAWPDNGSTLNSVTVCGNTATLYDNPTIDSGSSRSAWAVAVVGGSGNCTVTWTFSGSEQFAVVAHEVSGVSIANPVDGHKINTQDFPSAGTDALVSGNITTTMNGDYIMGAANDGGENETITAGTGFTARQVENSQSRRATSEDKIQSAAGTIQATLTNGGTGHHFNTGIMALRPSGGSGQIIMSSSTPAIATGRVKYRLSVPPSQAAGTYTNLVTYTILGTF